MSEIKVSGEPTASIVGADPYNTYGLATQGFVWAAISSVSGEFDGRVKSVNGVLPDDTGNVNVTSIRMEDYSGDVNEIRADLTVLSGDVEYRLLTNVDYSDLKKYTDDEISSLSADSKEKFDVIAEASGGWNRTEAKVEASSGDWDNVTTKVESSTAQWDNVYVSVGSLSSGWENARIELESASANWNNAETKVRNASGDWDNVYTSVNGTSGEWDTTYSTVNTLSAGWTNTVTPIDVPFGEDYTLSHYTSGIENPARGDVLILKKHLVEDDPDLFAYSSFSFNGEVWVPMAGNYDAEGVYDAENVFFTKNLTSSYAIGNIVLDNGKAEILSKGKNLKEVFDMIFLKENFPSKTNPSITLSTTGIGSYESGESFTPTYSITYVKGSYTYGPASEANATGYTVTFMGNTYTAQSGTFATVTATDSMSSANAQQRVSAYASYGTDTVVPVTNLGNPYPSVLITEGNTETKRSPYFTSYRQAFYGSLDAKDGTINSALVRGLVGRSGSYPVKGETVLPATYGVGAIRAVFAYPAALGDAESIIDKNGLEANIIDAFTKMTVQVNDASNGNPIEYLVYYKDAAIPNTTANTYTMHI